MEEDYRRVHPSRKGPVRAILETSYHDDDGDDGGDGDANDGIDPRRDWQPTESEQHSICLRVQKKLNIQCKTLINKESQEKSQWSIFWKNYVIY